MTKVPRKRRKKQKKSAGMKSSSPFSLSYLRRCCRRRRRCHHRMAYAIELTLISHLAGFTRSAIARVHVDSVSARFAEIQNESDKQPRNGYRANCVSPEDDGAEPQLWRSSFAHPQLGSHLGRVQRSESRPVHHGHAETRNDCR
jgi:hypothetical protein